jgi:hypothetical protein
MGHFNSYYEGRFWKCPLFWTRETGAGSQEKSFNAEFRKGAYRDTAAEGRRENKDGFDRINRIFSGIKGRDQKSK